MPSKDIRDGELLEVVVARVEHGARVVWVRVIEQQIGKLIVVDDAIGSNSASGQQLPD